MDFNAMHKQRKFVLIFAALGILSAFLPWFKVDVLGHGASVNGLHGNGIIVFLAFIACGAMAWLGDQKINLSKNAWLITLGAGAIALLFCVINLLNKGGAGGLGNDLVKVGLGLILATLSAAGVLYGAYQFRSASDNLKQSLKNMKDDIEKKVDNNPNT